MEYPEPAAGIATACRKSLTSPAAAEIKNAKHSAEGGSKLYDGGGLYVAATECFSLSTSQIARPGMAGAFSDDPLHRWTKIVLPDQLRSGRELLQFFDYSNIIELMTFRKYSYYG